MAAGWTVGFQHGVTPTVDGLNTGAGSDPLLKASFMKHMLTKRNRYNVLRFKFLAANVTCFYQVHMSIGEAYSFPSRFAFDIDTYHRAQRSGTLIGHLHRAQIPSLRLSGREWIHVYV